MRTKSLQMKRVLNAALFVLLLNVVGLTKLQAQNITFADANVKDLCVANWDTNGDGELSYAEAATVTSLGSVFHDQYLISSFDELRYFTGLTSINSYAFSYCYRLFSLGIPNSVTSMERYAFIGCSRLASIEIPNSVTSIGSNVFCYCTGLKLLTVLANNPPALSSDAFYSVNEEIPVYVPCGNIETYTAAGWGGFSNFIGCCGGTVSVAANLEGGGTVTGGGTFGANETCTVTASANEGYAFTFWTRNGIRTSANPEYTFCVTGDLDLVAHFVPEGNIVFADASVKSICVSYWDTNSDGELSYIEAAMVSNLGTVFQYNTSVSSFDELRYFIGLTAIDDWAFYGCIGLTSVEIPSSVTSIGVQAFENCQGLTSMTIWADNPPTLGSSAFDKVSGAIPVYVPCDAEEVYQNADGWEVFTNIMGMCSGEVAVTVNPSEGGTVTGAGYYDGGELCVLMATSNSGFSFANWTEEGRLVSRDTVFSFRAHPTTIVANFCSYSPIVFADANVKALCVANWDTNGDGELSYVEAAAVTSLDEVFGENSDIVSFDELQYFIGLTSIGNYAFYLCTGLTSIEIPNAVTEIGTSAFEGCSSLTSITVWAAHPPVLADGIEMEEEEWKDGFIGGTGIAFQGVNKCIPVYVPCNALEVYQNAEGWNEFTNIMGMCSGEVAVTVNPSEGGTVTGAGYYDGGELCVLTATSNPGFGFAYWTENGVLVSWDSVYSFHAHPTTIMANFCSYSPIVFADANVKALCVANWDTNGDGELSYVEAAAVTSLGNVFRDNSSISSFDELQYFVGLTSIGSNAFYNCSGLTSIQIPNFVTSIGGSAFYNCTDLISIEIPNSVTSIGYRSFYNCSGLRTVYVLADNPPFLGSSAFYGVDKYISVYVPCNAVETYQNADYWNEFTNIKGMCSGEVVVTINPSEGGTVAGAGYYDGGDLCVLTATSNPGFSFANWTEDGILVSWDSIYSFRAHPTTIVANFCSNSPIVFADANVKDLCVANWDTNGDGELSYAEAANVMSLGEVFRNNSSISSFDELQYFIGLTSISNYAFYYCSNLTSIEIPNSVNSIGNHAFMYCNELSSIEIPNSVTFIDSYAFYHCTSLTSIEIPNSVTSIRNYVFKSCTSLTSVEIPNSITYIGYELFGYCSGLTSVEIPNSVTSIADYAFRSCTGLTSIEIPNSVTSMGANAFASCNGLEQIVVEAGNTFFDSRDNCNAVIKTSTNSLNIGCKNTVIPNSVTSIGYGAFYGCSGLTSIEIPNAVTSLSSYAFYGCTGLAYITVHAETPPTLNSSTFENCPKSIPVYVPCGIATAYQSAECWSEFTNIQEVCSQSQIVSLSAGTNWFSTYLDITLDDLKAALVTAMSGTNTPITIKSKTQNVKYQNGRWTGSLTALNKTQMYKIIVFEACEITLEGTPIDPTTLSVTIIPGANWIAFPYSESMSVTNFFGSFPINNDVVKSKSQNTCYNNGRWAGQLNTLVPGQGYIYISTATGNRTFTFPASAK